MSLVAELGFRELLESDYWDDQKGSPFLPHTEQGGTLRADTVASRILIMLKITLFIF